MRFRKQLVMTLLLALMISNAYAKQKYEPNWESLKKHQVPEWMEDAKFGIYGHWGPYAVAFDWDVDPGMEIVYRCIYFNYLYRPDNDQRTLFERHIGPIDKGYGYKDLIDEFKAEKFDPAEWADLIAKSGAKYAGLAVIHHDGYALWDSDVNPWCAGKTGPRRDVYGELSNQLKKRGLKTVATFHHLRTHKMWKEYSTKPEFAKLAKKENWDILDPKYSKLYWSNTDFESDYIPYWNAQVKEVIDKYQPDMIWCDGGDMEGGAVGDSGRDWLAYYFNKAQEWGKEVSVHNKLTGTYGDTSYNFGPDFGVYTYENGRDRPERIDRPWEDDTSVGGTWPYYKGQEYMKPREGIVRLIDLVSKNGGLFVSLTPKPDGTLPQGVKYFLLGMGEWLGQNGDAIYGTRPWKIQAEGGIDNLNNITKKDGKINHIFRDNADAMTWECIRFTCKDNNLYVMCTGIPPKGKLSVKSLGTGTKISSENEIASIELLGSGDIEYTRNKRGLHLTLPKKMPNDTALAFKINVKGTLEK
jgi:alpha-L-fucosidase